MVWNGPQHLAFRRTGREGGPFGIRVLLLILLVTGSELGVNADLNGLLPGSQWVNQNTTTDFKYVKIPLLLPQSEVSRCSVFGNCIYHRFDTTHVSIVGWIFDRFKTPPRRTPRLYDVTEEHIPHICDQMGIVEYVSNSTLVSSVMRIFGRVGVESKCRYLRQLSSAKVCPTRTEQQHLGMRKWQYQCHTSRIHET